MEAPPRLTVELATNLEDDVLTAELYRGDELWAVVLPRRGALQVRVTAPQVGEGWDVPLDDVVAALLQAQRRLAGEVGNTAADVPWTSGTDGHREKVGADRG
jgi:hypothetical protein